LGRRPVSWAASFVIALLCFGAAGPAAAAPAAQSTAKKTTVQRRAPAATRYSAARARARRAALARARAAARAREAAALAVPQFKMSAEGVMVPDVRAAAAIIYNPITNEILWEEKAQDTRSIASITKLMTALVAFEDHADLSRRVVIDRTDVRAASVTYIRANEAVRIEDLLHLLLIGSDNAAARTLARTSSYGTPGFIDRMNEKAVELGLEHTRYADPSGLNAANVSSAYDMARLISVVANDERISAIMRKPEYTFASSRRKIRVNSTNKLLGGGGGIEVLGAKTGFIRQAGYCLASLLKMPQGDPIAVVVLGARSSTGRFMETKHLFNWLSSKAQSLLTSEPQN
jgi:D-alanyl-D-alanine endopeptidase (penicillin-binding protein 7)